MNTVNWLVPLTLVSAGASLLWRAFLLEPYDLKVEQRSVHMKGRQVHQPDEPAAARRNKAVPGGRAAARAADEPDSEGSGKADKNRSPASGLRILHITDLHMKGIGELQWRVLKEARALQPDLIAVTGDFLSSRRALAFLAPFLMELGQVAPIYAVLGDNDFEAANHPERLIAALQRSRVRLLRNEADLFIRGDRALLIVGVDDPHTHRADLAQALEAGSRLWRRSRFAAGGSAGDGLASAPIVVLAHSPEIVRDHDTRVGLYLTGHTHGGQICLPGGIALATNTRGVARYASGMFSVGDSWLYVNRGVGTARIPARLFCPPEIAVFDFQ